MHNGGYLPPLKKQWEDICPPPLSHQLAMITELERIRIGDPTKKRNQRHTVTLQQRLKTLCEKLNSNEKTLPEFLHAVGH